MSDDTSPLHQLHSGSESHHSPHDQLGAINLPARGEQHRIALVSDFFYPGFGGVEIHIYNVAQCLMRRGHKVIVITRAYGDRNGVRYVTNGLKVYYIPFIGAQLPPGTSTLPTLWGFLPLLRNILIRERITIVHGHQTTSNLCHESLFHAGVLGLKTCFTDHSLFGFSDAASIHINKVLQWALCCVDQVICVSNTSRENTVLRAKIPPQRVSVIPNATDTASFTPPDSMKYRTWGSILRNDSGNTTGGDVSSRGEAGSATHRTESIDSHTSSSRGGGGEVPSNPATPQSSSQNRSAAPAQQRRQPSIPASSVASNNNNNVPSASPSDVTDLTIVVITRLVYRKGADLFVDVIPEICRRHPRVKWVVGGDGPRRPQLEQMIERHSLYDRVKMMGGLKHSEVKDVLNQGQIFLNCSLTEAFCIALIEAASCGLMCVSTGVGGVPEVLPEEMLLLAEPEPGSIVKQLEEAILRVPMVSPWEFHDNVRKMYSWDWVAERTERVYDRINQQAAMPIQERLLRYSAIGRVYGMLSMCFCAINWLWLKILEWTMPEDEMEIAQDFPHKEFNQRKDRLLQDVA